MAVVSTLITLAINAAIAIGVSLIQKALTKKPKRDVQAVDAGQMVQRSLGYKEPLSVLVGRRNSGGTGYYDDGHGTKNEYGISVTVHSTRPMTSHQALFLDTERATLSGNPTTGAVDVTNIFLGKNNARRVKYRFFTGENNAGLGSYLSSLTGGRFSATDNFGQCAVSVMSCRNTNDDLDEDTGKNYIPFQGYPRAVPEGDGVKVCDPRIAGASYEDESTYVFSANAALIDAQYDYGFYDGAVGSRFKIVGNGYPVALMDVEQIKSNADYCDLRGYECHGRLRSGKNDDQEEIRKCYNATRYEVAGKVYTLAEGNRPRYGDLDLSECPSARVVLYDKDGDATDVYNQMQTFYVEPQEFYGDKELPLYTDAALLAADGGIPRETGLPLNFVTDKDQSARLEKEEMAILRATEKASIADLPLWCDEIPLGHIITPRNTEISEINDRDWVVEGKEENERGDIKLLLRIHFDNEATVNPPTPLVPITIPVPRPWPWFDLPDYVPPRVIGDVDGIIDGTRELADVRISGRGTLNAELNVTESFRLGILDGTQAVDDVNITGRGQLDPDLADIENNIGRVDADVLGIIAGTRSIAPPVITGQGNLIARIDAQDENINAALNAASSAGGGSLTATKSPSSAFGSGQNTITTGSVTITASGGAAPYSYAWTKVSGDTFTIGSASLATTNFSGAPGPYNEMSAVYKCIVTDANSDSFAMNVNVSAYDTTDFGNGGGGFEP